VKVRLLVGFSGATVLGAGQEVDVADDEALRLVAAGFAVAVAGKQVERTVAAPVTETRKARRGKVGAR
jgi:hypothetical protein